MHEGKEARKKQARAPFIGQHSVLYYFCATINCNTLLSWHRTWITRNQRIDGDEQSDHIIKKGVMTPAMQLEPNIPS